ncbi:MAG TPA: efflux RND transporter permease subunit [Gemmataceae bacterium]|nr:efflux RND transporter permease subunit [Gemmataceae bacterium]
MNPIVFALRHPITVMVALAGLLVGGAFAVKGMKVDIFPALNLPVVYVAQPYGGMDPAQMEGLITNYYEYHFLYIGGIHHVESKNIQGVALMKLYFHPGTDMAQAMAETIGYVNRSRAFMPVGTVPPFVMRFDTGSVPVGYLVFSSETKSLGEIQNEALFKVRPMFASLPGVSAPPPFGGNQRTIVIDVDPDKLRSYNLSPDDVVTALTQGNAISPSGNVRIKDQMPIVPVNALVKDPKELENIPLRLGENVYLRNVATVADSTDIPTGYALVNGRRAVYIVVTKRADASTLAVVNEVKKNLPEFKKGIPPDIDVRFEFDQSPYVTRAMWGVAIEALLGAVLTGLMVLLFLRDWRSVIVVVLNIPLALLASVVALWLTGATINLMTLGGLALAVGILVDEATVEVENIHTQMGRAGNIARAVRLGNSETAVPRLLAMLCILAVFLAAFFMEGAIRNLFVPLALAVGFAMIASYILSSTFVPVMSVWLLRHHEGAASEAPGFFKRLRDRYGRALAAVTRLRWLLAPGYLAGAAVVILLCVLLVGTEIFPNVDTGMFQLRLKAPTGTRIERTEEIAQQALDIIKEEVGPENVAISIGYVGVIPSSYPINTIFLWTSGPEEAVMRVALKRGSGVSVEALKEKLRSKLPQRLEEWLRPKLVADGLPPAKVEERLRGLRLSFEPADIVNEVMSFGSPTPVEVAVSGTKLAADRAHAEKIRDELLAVRSLRDVQMLPPFDYPTVGVKIDRERAGLSGVTAKDVANSVVTATSSSRFVVPVFWADPDTGIGYQVQVQIPPAKMDSAKQLELMPVLGVRQGQLLLRDVADVTEGQVPGEYDRYNMRRVVSLTANVEGEDLGSAAGRIQRAIARAGEPPAGVRVEVRGQVEPMRQMFSGLGLGLLVSVVVIFLLLFAYFQSFRLALAVLLTVPAVVAGVALALLLTRTTLNIQSFMGAIMAIGVAVANSILLVTFAERARRGGSSAVDAAVEGGRQRLRPILMTSCAMIAGMVPMALALGEGGQQTAPLARAVIGGLIAATLTTLFVLPSLFAVVQGRSGTQSVSLDPDDSESPHYDANGRAGGVSPPVTEPNRGAYAPRSPGIALLALALLLPLAGCGQTPDQSGSAPSPAAPAVTVIAPKKDTVRRTIDQPGRVEAFEQTPIYSKIAGYVNKFYVDIGAEVKEGDLLADLWVPEVEQQVNKKEATVLQKEAEVTQAKRLRDAAEKNVQSAEAMVKAEESGRLRAQAEFDRAQSQHEQLVKSGGAIDKEALSAARYGVEAARAAQAQVDAKVKAAEAARDEAMAKRDKAIADIAVAQANLKVAEADRDEAKAMFGYARITAPFKGKVSARNVDTRHFLQPAAAGNKGEPLFVVVSADTVRVFVDVPETDAGLVRDGMEAKVRVQALKGREFDGSVTRTSGVLDPRTRTLRTEIDLPNKDGTLLPGSYAYATLTAKREGVFTLPASAVVTGTEGTYCFRVEGTRVLQTPLQTGLSGGGLVEVLNKQTKPGTWEDVTGREEIAEKAATLKHGQEVVRP